MSKHIVLKLTPDVREFLGKIMFPGPKVKIPEEARSIVIDKDAAVAQFAVEPDGAPFSDAIVITYFEPDEVVFEGGEEDAVEEDPGGTVQGQVPFPVRTDMDA